MVLGAMPWWSYGHTRILPVSFSDFMNHRGKRLLQRCSRDTNKRACTNCSMQLMEAVGDLQTCFCRLEALIGEIVVSGFECLDSYQNLGKEAWAELSNLGRASHSLFQ